MLARPVNDRYTTATLRPCDAVEIQPSGDPVTNTVTLPTYDQVIRLPREYGPLVVPPDFEDENGHMNIRHYLDLGARAIDTAFRRIGLTDEYRATRRQGFFTAEHHLKYFAEI